MNSILRSWPIIAFFVVLLFVGVLMLPRLQELDNARKELLGYNNSYTSSSNEQYTDSYQSESVAASNSAALNKAQEEAAVFADDVVANGCMYTKSHVPLKNKPVFERIWQTICDVNSIGCVDTALYVCVFPGETGFSPVVLFRCDIDAFASAKIYLSKGWEFPECAYINSMYMADPGRFLSSTDRSNCVRLLGVQLPFKWTCGMYE